MSCLTKVKGTTWIQKEREIQFKMNPTSYDGRRTYFTAIPQQHVKSAKKWMEDGLFLRSDMPAFAENPTLTGYNINKGRPAYSYSYCIGSDILPFTGWDYLEVKKFKHVSSLITMYGAYIENVLRAVMKKLSTKQVSFQVILCDCLGIEKYVEEETKYDRILTSNLMDYIILPRLLKICSRKLNHENLFATIVTETHNWTRDFCTVLPEADFGSSATMSPNMFSQFIRLEKTALEDTNNPQQVEGANSVREYLDNSTEFIDFIRALFHAYSIRKGRNDDADSIENPKIPTFKVLGNEFQLKLRDGFRNENRIAVFKMAINRRRVTMTKGIERVLEWVSLYSE